MVKHTSTCESSLILETSLQTFFFDQLLEINQKFQAPLPNETIFYSSLVMDKFGLSKEYFEFKDGKVKEKTLGLKLLESTQLTRKEQQRSLKDIGDTALFLCGYFSDSVNEKFNNLRYYRDIGQMAYRRLDSFVPSFYDVDSFYTQLSKQFESLANLMRIAQRENHDCANTDESMILFLNETKIKAS